MITAAGDVYLWDSLFAYKRHHFVVVSDPSIDPILVCNFTSHKPGVSDEACIVDAGECAHLKLKSVIYYRGAETISRQALANDFAQGVFLLKTPVSPELLSRIRQGFFTSDFAAPDHVAFLESQGITEIT